VGSIAISILVGVLTFAFGYLGMLLQRMLPQQHMTSGSRDMIGAVQGLIALLVALVLGTLVGSAYAFFAIQKSNVETMGSRAIALDMALEQYGPEAAPLRQGLKMAIEHIYEEVWSGHVDPQTLAVRTYLPSFRKLNEGISALSPKTPAQTQLLATIGANAAVIEQTRLLMSLQLASPVSWPLLTIVVSWAMLLFCGFGILSRLNATSVAAAAIGAFAVGSAVFLILELNSPFKGVFLVPGGSVEETIRSLGG
jgi:hypothetical protein